MCWKWVNPLRDLWEGASLGERELPWTRERVKEEKKKGRKIKSKETRKERRRRRGQRCCLVGKLWILPGLSEVSCRLRCGKKPYRIYERARELDKRVVRWVDDGGTDAEGSRAEQKDRLDNLLDGLYYGHAPSSIFIFVLGNSDRRRSPRSSISTFSYISTIAIPKLRHGTNIISSLLTITSHLT